MADKKTGFAAQQAAAQHRRALAERQAEMERMAQDEAAALAYQISVYWRGLEREMQQAHLALWPKHEPRWALGPRFGWGLHQRMFAPPVAA